MNTQQQFTATEAKYLRGLAHGLKPVVFIGQKGMTDALIQSVEVAFDRHELIKVKFLDFKEKRQKRQLATAIAQKTGSLLAGIIGHLAILYKPHSNPEKRRIVLPG
jgi:RNA-binding protein